MAKTAAYTVIAPLADLQEDPMHQDHIGRRNSQLLLGEIFDVESRDGAYFKGKSRHDGYQGYVAVQNLIPREGRARHFVENNLTLVHHGPDIKSGIKMSLSFLSRLEIERGTLQNGFVRATGLGWVPQQHIKLVSALSRERIDHVAVALRYLGAPYRYAGRSPLGIDCSGLTQNVLMRAGFKRIPRDADMQEKSDHVGALVSKAQRGDIVFFKGHVGIMIDNKNIISATEKYAGVVIETLVDMAARQGGITAIRRPATKPTPQP